MDRVKQILATFRATAAKDPKLVPYTLVAVLGTLAVFAALAILVSWVFWISGVLGAVLAAIVVLGRRAEKAALAEIAGRPGAAAAVLQAMRGPWKVTPAIGFNRRQDLVHLVVGRPGVVLVAEAGTPARAKELMGTTKRRVAKAAGSAPVHEVIVGDGEGQVPLRGLSLHVTRLPRALKPKEIGPLETKLSALKQHDLPMPKGPIPRPPRGKYR